MQFTQYAQLTIDKLSKKISFIEISQLYDISHSYNHTFSGVNHSKSENPFEIHLEFKKLDFDLQRMIERELEEVLSNGYGIYCFGQEAEFDMKQTIGMKPNPNYRKPTSHFIYYVLKRTVTITQTDNLIEDMI